MRGAGRGNSPLKPVVFSDFDGTISRLDVIDIILEEFADASWRKVEELWLKGEIGSRECLEQQMALVQASQTQLGALIDAIPLDPDFQAFYSFIRDQKLPFYIVSDGFDYVIRRVLRRVGANGELHNGRHLFASALRWEAGRIRVSFPHGKTDCAHGCATCKPAVIRRVRKQHRPVIFVGDGLSDRFAVEAADVIFAKKDLLAYCRKNGLACQPFETFRDVQAGVEQLLAAETGARDAILTAAT